MVAVDPAADQKVVAVAKVVVVADPRVVVVDPRVVAEDAEDKAAARASLAEEAVADRHS